MLLVNKTMMLLLAKLFKLTELNCQVRLVFTKNFGLKFWGSIVVDYTS